MRLRPEKIEQLAELVHQTLAKKEGVQLVGAPNDIVFEISLAITEDLEEEDEIEAEAKRLLEQHAKEVDKSGIRMDQALRRAKEKIARNRKFTL